MSIPFIKMHGCGNDYVYVDCFKTAVSDPEKLAISISDRHKGVGGDGLVLICPSLIADAKMRMFNMDGSEGKMCGNAIRCVAKYLCDSNKVLGNELTIETLSGIKKLTVFKKSGVVDKVTVDMGMASIEPKSLPITSLTPMIGEKYAVSGVEYKINCISMGNPHCVVFVPDPYRFDVENVGKAFEFDSLFPERVNTEFVSVTGKNELTMRVWERGSGETLACGTGACAAAYAAILNGFCTAGEDITVRLRGGDLTIRCEDTRVYMTGEAVKVFEGVYYEDRT